MDTVEIACRRDAGNASSARRPIVTAAERLFDIGIEPAYNRTLAAMDHFRMVTLYQLHWSHYVEKVRWALDYKNVEWSVVDVDPFTKRQMQHLQCKLMLDSGREMHAVPTIHDRAMGSVIGDSTKILDYLERTYPKPAAPLGLARNTTAGILPRAAGRLRSGFARCSTTARLGSRRGALAGGRTSQRKSYTR